MLLYVTKGTLGVIKDLEMGDCPGFSRWVHCYHKFFYVEGGGRRDGKMLRCRFQRWNKATSQECSGLWKVEKAQKWILPWSFQKEPALFTPLF